jgi:hypothetical protein
VSKADIPDGGLLFRNGLGRPGISTRTTFEGDDEMDGLTLFGLFAVTAMVLCYAFEGRSPCFVLAFAGTCVLASIYGFLQGAWPFGIVEGIWALVALRRWQKQAALA